MKFVDAETQQVREYKCPRCKKVRGTRCGFDGKKRFHLSNSACQTLDALKLAMQELGTDIMGADQMGLFRFCQAKVDDVWALVIWKIEYNKTLMASEMVDGVLTPMRLATAERIIEAATARMAGKYEDAENQ